MFFTKTQKKILFFCFLLFCSTWLVSISSYSPTSRNLLWKWSIENKLRIICSVFVSPPTNSFLLNPDYSILDPFASLPIVLGSSSFIFRCLDLHNHHYHLATSVLYVLNNWIVWFLSWRNQRYILYWLNDDICTRSDFYTCNNRDM